MNAKNTLGLGLRKTVKKYLGAALLACLAICLFLLTGCGQEENTTIPVVVLGNTLSDLSRDGMREAIERIAAQNPITGDLTVDFLGKKYGVSLQGVSAQYDVEAMADQAFKSGTPTLWQKTFGSAPDSVEVPLTLKYDEEALDRQAAMAARVLSRGSSSFSYEIGQKEITVTKGGQAASIDKEALLSALKERLGRMDYSPLKLEADVQHDEIDFEALKAELDRPVLNPRLDLENDPSGETILDGQRGVEVDLTVAKKAYEDSGSDDTFSFPAFFTEPDMTLKEFQEVLFRDTLSTKTSSFNPSLIGRTINVKLACDFCNETVLNPGDEFSYNGAVGPRTYERGFKDATVYVAGTTEEDVGGGICQVSSTIYSAALHADLQINERHNHSYMITYVPLGEDATVVYGSKDFRFVNNTDYPIKIRITYGKSTMTVSIIGTKTQEKEVKMVTKTLSSTPFQTIYQTDNTLPLDTTKVKNNGYTGFVTETYRHVYIDGEKVSETFENKSVYKKLDKLILENPSSPEKSGNYVPPVEQPSEPPLETPPDQQQPADPGQETPPAEQTPGEQPPADEQTPVGGQEETPSDPE